MSSQLNSFVPVLDGTNYQQWASSMQSYLLSQGQWNCVKAGATPPVVVTLTSDNPEVEDTKTGEEEKTKWLETADKALGNIRLRLHHNIYHQYEMINNPADLWRDLLNKYGSPGVTRALSEFKGFMETTIPNGQDPGPALKKIQSHFVNLKKMGWEVPIKVQGMIMLSKAPPSMEAVIQLFSQMLKNTGTKESNLQPERVAATMRRSWEMNQRAGGGKSNQQQVNKISAVKPAQNSPPNFQQQQQPQQQQHRDGDARGRGRGRRGKRGGKRNAQQQLQQVEMDEVEPYSRHQPGPSNQPSQQQSQPQVQWVPMPTQPPANYGNPYSPTNPFTNQQGMGYFASAILAGRPLPPVPPISPLDSQWPTFGKALELAHPTTETLKTLEMAEMAKERITSHPRPRKHARKELPRGYVQGIEGKLKDDDVVSLDFTEEGMDQDLANGNDQYLGNEEYNVDSEVADLAGLELVRQVQSPKAPRKILTEAHS